MTLMELKMQPAIHLQSKFSASIFRFALHSLQMDCGLHFQFRRGHYITREIPEGLYLKSWEWYCERSLSDMRNTIPDSHVADLRTRNFANDFK
jgi:hypothetical protein